MLRLFNLPKGDRIAHTSRAICEPLEHRRLLSAASHSAGMKLHRVADLSIVQDLVQSTMNIATITGPGTSAITPGEFPASDNVGVRAEIRSVITDQIISTITVTRR